MWKIYCAGGKGDFKLYFLWLKIIFSEDGDILFLCTSPSIYHSVLHLSQDQIVLKIMDAEL